ncbi:MAG TPA: ribonuclease P protein subunit [archaeon]|nr:ribonuclease P protein subunit [archaeon]
MLKGENYCITQENIIFHELIGLVAKVTKSSDHSRRGIVGRVIDETRNVLVLEVGAEEKWVPKEECEFEFIIGNETAKVDGKKIAYRPEQRVKLQRGN